MNVDVYTVNETFISSVELQPSEIEKYMELIKEYGCKDNNGNEYRLSDAKVYNNGFIIYVESDGGI